MKLLTVEIENYRSIVSSGKIHFHDFLLLVGPNNTGKSTVLKALDLFFNNSNYNSDRDYPEQKKGKVGYRKPAKFKLTFIREPGEKLGKQLSFYIVKRKIADEFKDAIVIEIEYPRDYNLKKIRKIKINGKYKGSDTNLDKYNKVFQLIKKRISYAYIPASRLSDDTSEPRFIGQLLAFMLSRSKTYRANYKDFIKGVSSLIADAKKSIVKNVHGFPEVKSIEFDWSDVDIVDLTNKVKTIVTEQSEIPLIQQGTGLQSAFIVAVIKHILSLQEKKSGELRMILGIEEPEVFLHPPAQRGLLQALRGSQSVISTHSPTILDELGPDDFKNIVRCRKNIADAHFFQLASKTDIKLLTLLYEDSDLTGGEFFFGDKTLLVEGTTDRAVLRKLFRSIGYFSSVLVQVGGNTKFEKPLKLISQFDIPVTLVTDEDTITGPNSAKFASSLTKQGLISHAEWVVLKQLVVSKISTKKGAERIYKHCMALPKPFSFFIFPGELESSMIDENNSDLTLKWLLSYGRKKFNLPDSVVKDLQQVQSESQPKKTQRLKTLMTSDPLKIRYITEQLFDLLLKSNAVPAVYKTFGELMKGK